MLHSTLGRHGARAIRAAVLSELALKQWQLLTANILQGDTTIYNKPAFPKNTNVLGGWSRRKPSDSLG